MELPEFNSLQDLHEVHDMLSERIKKWPDRWIAEGRREGRQEGRQEGVEKGRQEARREIARNLIASTDMSDSAISEVSLLPVEEVAKLRVETQH